MPFAQLSNVDLLGDASCVFKLDTEIPNRAVHLGVAEQKLGRAQITSLTVDLRSFRASERMSAHRT